MHDLADAVDRWRPGGSRVPEDVTLEALYQQRILILLSEKRALSTAVLRRLPNPRPLRSEVLARRELGRLSQPRPVSAFRTGPAAPAARLGAANYLHANGAPRNYRRALYRYNPSWLYVDAVLRYASLIRADPRAYYVFYSRQVFVRTPHGLVRLTGPR